MKSRPVVRTGLLALALVFGGGLLFIASSPVFAGGAGESAAYAFSNASRDAGVTFHSPDRSSSRASEARGSESLGRAFEWSGATRDAGVVLPAERAERAVEEAEVGNPAGDEESREPCRRAASRAHPSGLTQEEAQAVLGGWFE